MRKKKSLSLSEKRKKLAEQKKQKKARRQNLQAHTPPQGQLIDLLGHYQNGRFGDAEELAISITREFPQHVFAWKVLGAVLGKTGRKSEAVNADQTAVALSPEDADAHYNLGVTLQELGRFSEAEASYRQATTLVPNLAEAHNNLGNMLKDLGRFVEAEVCYTGAIASEPGFAEAYCNLGNTLLELGRLEEAEASYEQAINLKSGYIEAHNRQLECLYLLDKRSDFFNELDYLINQGTANAIIGSFTCRSTLKYGLEKPNLFCTEPLEYVLHSDLTTQYDFGEIFVKKAKSILNERRISNRKQSLLANGYQTSGNLFDIQNEFTNKIQETIRLEVERYRIKFQNSEEGFIRKWPTEYSLYGWLVTMKSGGELQPHIHKQGWLSGSIYINIPQKLRGDSGKFVVSVGEDTDAIHSRVNVKKVVDVVTGSLVLFPASLTHYTIPFESEEERVVLAFDVKQR